MIRSDGDAGRPATPDVVHRTGESLGTEHDCGKDAALIVETAGRRWTITWRVVDAYAS